MADMTPGFYPFWFWNGDLDEEEIRRQVQEMASQGISGFYIHPRQGLTVPYLSDSFFRLVESAVDEAAKLGLTVHLYDEYPYPSGVAGGEAILGEPAFHATRLVQRAYDFPAGGKIRQELPQGKVLACYAYPLQDGQVIWEKGQDLQESVGMVLTDESYVETGLTMYNRKRYFASGPTPMLEAELPTGPHRVYVSVQAVVEGHKYWHHFIDVLNPKAVQTFIRLTHERYKKRLGEHFGRTIVSIFTDETEPGWSARLPQAFQHVYGQDLSPLLPALQDPSHPKHDLVSFQLHRLRYQLFVESFEKPIRDWCREHGLKYAGEKPSLRFSQLGYSDVPGCDPGHTKAGAKMDILLPPLRSNARAVASAAYFYDKPASLCECYHSLGWSGTLQDAKVIAEGLLLMGITWLVPHGFFYTTHSLKKHDAPPSFFEQMPYWPLFGHLSHRVQRILNRFEGTYIDAQVLVIDPTSGLPDSKQSQAYGRLLDLLMGDRIDFLIADTDVLESGTVLQKTRAVAAADTVDRPKIDSAELENITTRGGEGGDKVEDKNTAVLRLKDIDVKTVIVPPMRVVEEPLKQWLQGFSAQGGDVIWLDEDFDSEILHRQLVETISPHLDLKVTASESHAANNLWMVTRSDGRRKVTFFLNTGREPLEVVIGSNGPLREVPLDDLVPTGLESIDEGLEPSDQDASNRTKGFRYKRLVHPLESFLLEEVDEFTGHERGSQSRSASKHRALQRIALQGPLEVKPHGLNLLRLGSWRMGLVREDNDVEWVGETRAMPIANQLKETGASIVPIITPSFGQPPQLAFPLLEVRYQASFEMDYKGQVSLLMEPQSLTGDWRILVNEGLVITEENFEPIDAHVRGSVGVDITEALKPGRNDILVELTADRSDQGLRNPLYLAGEFGVWLDPVRIASRPTYGTFDGWEANGLPFYAGVVDYHGTFHYKSSKPPSDEVSLLIDFGLPFDDACEVSVNGGSWTPLLWSPRTALFDAKGLKPGINRISVRVYTTLIRSFEGQRFDITSHAYQDL